VMGLLLLVFAAGLLGDAVQNMQGLGWLHFGTTPLWNTSHILSEDTAIGDILHTFIGYSEQPTVLQGLLYTAYLLVAGSLFAWMTRKPNAGGPVHRSVANTRETVHSRT